MLVSGGRPKSPVSQRATASGGDQAGVRPARQFLDHARGRLALFGQGSAERIAHRRGVRAGADRA
jgi:hypothetical protein